MYKMVDVQNVRNVFEEAHTSNGTKQLKVYFIYVEMKSKLGERERQREERSKKKEKKIFQICFSKLFEAFNVMATTHSSQQQHICQLKYEEHHTLELRGHRVCIMSLCLAWVFLLPLFQRPNHA